VTAPAAIDDQLKKSTQLLTQQRRHRRARPTADARALIRPVTIASTGDGASPR
jgi:hypothetical protein